MAMPADSAFAELLRKHRRAAGYSQEALAERSRLSARAIAALEQGNRRAPYRDTVTALGNALGLSPNERADLEEAAASARGRPRQPSPGLPPSLTSFIDRTEVAEISALLQKHRLLTITGSGGVGKTRIALEVTRRLAHPQHHIWFVDLLPLRDKKQLITHVAARLDVQVDGEIDETTIAQQVRPYRTFLVLDNGEHIIVELAALVGFLLRECPLLSVLVTSREPLGHSAESTFQLPPMNESTAIDLFLARAKAADRTIVFNAARLAVVAEICKDLDRIPLAIELAASRVSALGFDELRKRLKGGVIFVGGRDLPARHQTMSATISWSFELLTEVDRLLLERLSVFIGGFNLSMAETVCADTALPIDGIADSVLRLVQKSLIERELVATSTRYRFLESIRSFAWQRLSERTEVNGTMLRLLSWFVEQARSLSQHQSLDLIDKFGVELDNLASTINWAITIGHAETIVAAAWALVGFRSVYSGTGRHGEMRMLGITLLEKLHYSECYDSVGPREHFASLISDDAPKTTLSRLEFPRPEVPENVATLERHVREWRALLLASQRKHVRSILNEIIARPASETLTAHPRVSRNLELRTVRDELEYQH
jgi:predicted ATPase/DNA-binding XRE family transcriptional regulator